MTPPGWTVALVGVLLSVVGKGSHGDERIGAVIEVTKCCGWGESIDADSLACRASENSTREGFLARNLRNHRGRDLYRISHGTPVCQGSALSVAVGGGLDRGGSVDEYCVDDSANGTVLLSCGSQSEVCRDRPCLRKCKSLGRFYGRAANVTEGPPFDPVIYNLTSLTPDASAGISRFGILFGLHCPGGKIRLDHGESDINYLGTNGSLYVPGHRQSNVFSVEEYCLEYVAGEGIYAFLCLPAEDDVDGYVLLALGFIASCVCLMATFFVFLCSRKSKSLYGKTLMCYVGCLCIAYLSLAIVHLGNRSLRKGTCTLLGYSILLSFLAAFFWLNIMSIDIWKTFRSIRSSEWRKTPNVRSRFTAYSIYGWGAPLALTLVCGLLDVLPDVHPGFNVDLIQPRIGFKSCWFSKSTYGMYVFFLAPVSVIVTCNIVLYISTAWRCWKVKAEINALGAQCGRRRGKYSLHRDQLLLNGKLFIVMGVSWGPEFLSNFLPHPLWKITDALNTLLGVFIFAVFVLKKKTIYTVTQKLRRSLRNSSRKISTSDYQKSIFRETERSSRYNTCSTNI